MSQGEENKGALSGISEEDLARLKAQMLLEMRQKKPEASAETLKPEEPSTPQGEPVGAPSMAHKPEVTPKGKKPKKPKSLARKIIEWVGVVVVGALFIVVLAGQIDSMVHSNEHYGQPLRFGWGSFVVRTSSMEPEYPVDSAIITHNDDADDIYNRFLNLKEDEHIDITFMDAYDIYGDPYGEFAAPKSEDEKTTFVQRTGLTRVPMTHRLRAIHVNEEVASGEGRYYFFVSGINNKGEKSLEGQYQVFNEKYILGVVKFNSPFLGGFFSFISSPWGLFGLLLIPAFYLVIVSVADIFKALKESEEPATPDGSKPPVGGDNLSAEDRERLKQQMLAQMMQQRAEERRRQAQVQGTSEPAPEEEPKPIVEEKPSEEPKPAVPEEKPAEPKPNPLSGLSEEEIARLKAEMLMSMKKKGGGK